LQPACLPTCLAVALACLFLLFLQDAITRANLYADAGADAIYVEAPISKQELAIIGQKVINFFK
jgi:2-methylisocitrate lyase-like PEP mutase family enzyme